MMRLKGKVTYLDGTVEEYTGGINALAAWEQHAHTRKLDSSPEKSPMTWTLYVAFASLGATRTGKDIGFDTWTTCRLRSRTQTLPRRTRRTNNRRAVRKNRDRPERSLE